MGENSAYPIFQGTWAAHAQLTFIAASSMQKKQDNETDAQNVIFYLDNRDYGMENPTKDDCVINQGSNKAYGFTVRPVKDNPWLVRMKKKKKNYPVESNGPEIWIEKILNRIYFLYNIFP